MQRLNEIRDLLARYGLRPQKRYGQNFLHDQNKIRQIIELADLSPESVVLEVGPGTGTLTEALLATSCRVVACEIDDDLIPLLREVLGDDSPTFRLVHADILAGKRTINPRVIEAIRAVSTDEQGVAGAFQLIANLPYNIASPLLANLAADHPEMTNGLVMVQREVADRLAAGPGGKAYGPLTIMVQNAYTVSLVMTLPPGCFYPPPQIHSAVVQLTRRAQPITTAIDALGELTQRLFQKRRKQLGSILGRDLDWPDDIDPTARPEQLTIEQIARLATRV